MEHLVSAVITTHNRKDFLEKALQSALSQTYANMEIIVVDDRSTDGTKEYMEALVQSRADRHGIPVQYIYNANGGGGNHARNTGICAAKGEYIAFLDDDDEWLPEKTKKQADYLDQHAEVGIVGCGKIDEFDLKERSKERIINTADGDMSQRIFKILNFTTSCLMIRKSLLIKVGMFDESIQYWQDYELLIRLCQNTKFVQIGEHLTLFRIRMQDKNRLSNNLAGWEKSVKYLEEKHQKLIEALPPKMRLAHYKTIIRDGINRCNKNNDKKRKRWYLKQRFLLEPSINNAIRFILNRERLRQK